MSAKTEPSEVWVGIKACGCPVAVVVHRDEFKDARKHTEETKHEFLEGGLSVVRTTWDQWVSDYLPRFSHCPHGEKQQPTAVQLPLVAP